MNIKLFIRKQVILYILLVIAFTLLMIVSNLIPSSSIARNVLQSSRVLDKEGVDPRILNYHLFTLDNNTDALMIAVCYAADCSKPVESSMMNYYYHSDDPEVPVFSMEHFALNKQAVNETGALPMVKEPYTRYWHGYEVFLRPALTVFNYSQIRIINYVLFTILLLFCIRLIYKKIGLPAAVLFGLSLLLINFPIVPLCMQYSIVFYVAFAAILFILTQQKILEKEENVFGLFFVIGAVEVYLDFITPLVSLGLPLTIYLLSVQKDKKYLRVIEYSVAWLLGYALLWASKWGVAYLLTGFNPFVDAIQQVELRTSRQANGMDVTYFRLLRYGLKVFLHYGVFIAGFLIVYFVLLKNRKVLRDWGWLLLIAAEVPVWWLGLRNHTIIHWPFTWRACVIMLLAGLLFIYHTVDWQKMRMNPFKK